MISARYLGARYLVLLLSLASPLAFSQVRATNSASFPETRASSSAAAAEQQSSSDDVPEVPGLSSPPGHWNAGITFSGFHQSTTGWATLAVPAVGYTINDIFSIDTTIPIYMYRLAPNRRPHPKPDAYLVNQRGELGDAIFSLHAQFLPRNFLYESTFAFTVPTGDETYGLTTGRVTFDLNNHFERSYGRFTPNLEIGAGDSTTLVNRSVNKTYTSLGPLAHFQIGLGMDLFRRLSFESDAYEQLPIGDQKIYSAFRKGRPTVVVGYNVTEDNGFTNALDFRVDSHTTLSGYYSRSLRRSVDTVGIGITYVLRGAPKEEEEEQISIDELFR